MADLDSLIKYRKHIVDEKQKFLGLLYAQTEKLNARKQAIIDQMTHEKEHADKNENFNVTSFLGKYIQGAKGKIQKIDKDIAKMEVRIAAAQEEVRAAFAEQKKIEIVKRERKAAEAAEIKAKEDRALDEVAIEGFRRKQEAGD